MQMEMFDSQMLKMRDNLELGIMNDAVIIDAKRGGMQSLKSFQQGVTCHIIKKVLLHW